MLNKNRPIIIRYRQNDASVEAENYLKRKNWLIQVLQQLHRDIKFQQQLFESINNELTERINQTQIQLVGLKQLLDQNHVFDE